MEDSVSLYVHIPFCRKKCDYCDFFSLPRGSGENPVSDEYVDSLLHEAVFYKNLYSVSSWKTIYLGGGTPSLLSPGQLRKLLQGLISLSSVFPEEITVEINPESLTPLFLEAAKDCGVNRLSVGIQSLNDEELSAVNRGCTRQQALKALSLLENQWKGRLSTDLIAGLPGQTKESLQSSIRELSSFSKIDHISLYTLTIEDGTPLAAKIDGGEVDWDYQKADELWLLGRDLLENCGYFQYEVSNFAKPGYESIHNQTYWNLEDYIGIGSGASGTVYGSLSQTGCRWNNSRNIHDYLDFWKAGDDFTDLAAIPREIENLEKDTEVFEYVMMGFRLRKGISSNKFFNRFGKSLEEYLGCENGVFKKWENESLAQRKIDWGGDSWYSLNRQGILLLNRFLEELL